jgi:uncharacterized protein (DUF2267 family)
VRAELPSDVSPGLARDGVDAVFRVLDRHISTGELDDVRHCLPRAVRDAWTFM